MTVYRCMFFIGADHKITNMVERDHPDDACATDWGRELLRRHPHYRRCEVWQRQRFVCRHDQ